MPLLTAISEGVGLAKKFGGLFGGGGSIYSGNQKEWKPQRAAVQKAYESMNFSEARRLWKQIPPDGRYPGQSLQSHVNQHANSMVREAFSKWLRKPSGSSSSKNVSKGTSQVVRNLSNQGISTVGTKQSKLVNIGKGGKDTQRKMRTQEILLYVGGSILALILLGGKKLKKLF